MAQKHIKNISKWLRHNITHYTCVYHSNNTINHRNNKSLYTYLGSCESCLTILFIYIMYILTFSIIFFLHKKIHGMLNQQWNISKWNVCKDLSDWRIKKLAIKWKVLERYFQLIVLISPENSVYQSRRKTWNNIHTRRENKCEWSISNQSNFFLQLYNIRIHKHNNLNFTLTHAH